MSIALAVRVSPLFALRRSQTTVGGTFVGQDRLILTCLRSGDRKLQMSDNCIVRGLLAFCYLKQDLQDEQDEQDVGVLCSQPPLSFCLYFGDAALVKKCH